MGNAFLPGRPRHDRVGRGQKHLRRSFRSPTAARSTAPITRTGEYDVRRQASGRKACSPRKSRCVGVCASPHASRLTPHRARVLPPRAPRRHDDHRHPGGDRRSGAAGLAPTGPGGDAGEREDLFTLRSVASRARSSDSGSAGTAIAARMPMIVMTTRSSRRENPCSVRREA